MRLRMGSAHGLKSIGCVAEVLGNMLFSPAYLQGLIVGNYPQRPVFLGIFCLLFGAVSVTASDNGPAETYTLTLG